MIPDVLIKLLLSLALGALIGIERERHGAGGELVEGMRTFMLISFFATLSAYFSEILNSFLIVIVAFVFAGLLTVLGYMSKTRKKHFGLTTEIAFLLTFVIGLIVYYDSYPYLLSVASALILTFVLASKGKMHRFAKHLKENEIYDALIFGILAFVILPLLPNQPLTQFSINPFVVWLSIILILAIGFVGYIAMKIFGIRNGIVLEGALGGFVSSTAVSLNMAEDTKQLPKIYNSAAFATTVASSTMFLRMIVLIFIFNSTIAYFLALPLALLASLGYLGSTLMWERRKKETRMRLSSPLSLRTAFSFGAFFVLVFFLVHFAQAYFGASGILLLAFLTGLADVDAISISLATLAISTISPMIAIQGILLAALSNTLSKWVITKVLGNRNIAKDVGKVFIFVLGLGAGILIFLSI